MPQMKPMMWTLMLVTTSIVLMIVSAITHFSYSDKLPIMSPKPYQPNMTMKHNKYNNDK